MMNFLKGLFKAKEREYKRYEYKGYIIEARPMQDKQGYRLSGIIYKGERSKPFIRADLVPSYEACEDLTIDKGRQVIDQLGDQYFD